MKERPILFSAPMVRAILEGRKTQTRRVVKLQPDRVWPDEVTPHWNVGGNRTLPGASNPIRCPYGVPGDRLWVRETIQVVRPTDWEGAYIESVEVWDGKLPTAAPGKPWRTWYGADLFGTDEDPAIIGRAKKDQMVPRWRPSIYMPRWASRITLEVTDVRVERLQDISEEDAKAEGIERSKGGQWLDYESDGRGCVYSAVNGFHSLWDSINGPGAWSENPWVWVLSFKRIGGGA